MIFPDYYDNKTDKSNSIKTDICCLFSANLGMIHNIDRAIERDNLNNWDNDQEKVFKIVSHLSVSR